jgi:hypothetical protein
LAVANGEFVGFLDDDDVWLPGHVKPHLEILQHQPAVALVYAQGVLADADLNPVYPPAPEGPLPGGDIFVYSLEMCFQWNTIVARRRVLLELGGFDETLTSSEDWDLQLRVAARYDCAGVAVPVTLYRQADTEFRGYESWRSGYRQTIGVLKRAVRLPARTRVPRRQRLLLTFTARGWFAYRCVHSADHALSLGMSREALRCLVGAMQIAPLHALFHLPGYWPAVAATLGSGLSGLLARRAPTNTRG